MRMQENEQLFIESHPSALIQNELLQNERLLGNSIIEPAVDTFYTPKEELIHSLTHGIGVLFSLGGLGLLLYLAFWYGDWKEAVAFTTYGAAVTFLFLASTLYHSAQLPEKRRFWRLVDHAAIFLVIAGTYTPLLLLGVMTVRSAILLVIIWALALFGAGFKLLVHDPHRFENLSLVMYLGMGWMAAFVGRDIFSTMPANGLLLLVAGGLLYTLGVLFYRWETLPYNHAIWHLIVLLASACHFFSILSLVWVI